jgi:pimeloyl-ACP methyl ester carboxylesterase
MVRRSYVDGPFGQIHLRSTAPVPGALPLVCLHATAYSSRSFVALMQAAGWRRQLIAIDLPGYGESDAPPEPVEIAAYAEAIGCAIAATGNGPVALLGYHTGVYVGAELAIRQPDLVERLILIGIPYFQALDLALWRAKLAARHELGAALSQFDERWEFFVARRAPGVSRERGFEHFVDELKAWPNGWWAHEAMFAYDSDARLPLLRQPVLVINPDAHLAHPSRVAAGMMPGARVEEMPDVSGPILNVAPDRIVAAAETWFASDGAL